MSDEETFKKEPSNKRMKRFEERIGLIENKINFIYQSAFPKRKEVKEKTKEVKEMKEERVNAEKKTIRLGKFFLEL